MKSSKLGNVIALVMMSPSAVEVLIFTGSKEISVKRNIARSKGFLKMMMNSFRK